MILETGNVYKYAEPAETEEEIVFDYYMCISQTKQFYRLEEIEQWSMLNGQADNYDNIEDLDEYFIDAPELEEKHFKVLNSSEALYFKRKLVEKVISTEGRRRFSIV